MSTELEAVGQLVRRLEALGIPYMVAGSVASSHHGRPRATNDADIVIDPAPEALDALAPSPATTSGCSLPRAPSASPSTDSETVP